jgi:hypothetical protein
VGVTVNEGVGVQGSSWPEILFCVQRVGVMLGTGVGVGVQFTLAKG